MVCYASLAATVYNSWKIRSQSYWNGVVLRPYNLIKQIQADVCIRVRARTSATWSTSDIEWFDKLYI